MLFFTFHILFLIIFTAGSILLLVSPDEGRQAKSKLGFSFMESKLKRKRSDINLNKEKSFIEKKRIFIKELLRKAEKSKNDFLKLIALFFILGGGIGFFLFSGIFLSIATGLCFVPLSILYLYIKTQEQTRAELSELENAMSIITNTYLSSNDILRSFASYIAERNRHLSSDLKTVTPFDQFVTEYTMISPDIDKALINLSGKINNMYFKDWVKNLRLCSDNKDMRFSLKPVIDAMQDEKILQIESDSKMKATWFTYFTTVGIAFSILPILRFSNADWYRLLVYTPVGKILVLTMLLTALFSAIYVSKINRPIGQI